LTGTKSFKSSCRLIKAKAKELMLTGENHINILLGLIAVSSAAVAPMLICSMLYDQLGDALYTLILLAMEFFFVLPMVFALIGMARAMSKGERVPFSKVFSPYASIKEYLRSIAMSLVATVILVIMMFGVAIVIGSVPSFFEEEPRIVETAIGAIIGIIATALSVFLAFRLAAMPALLADGNGFWRSVKLSFSVTRKKCLRMLGIMISFLPLTAISVLAVCVPLYVYTLPYLLCVYSVGVDEMINNNE